MRQVGSWGRGLLAVIASVTMGGSAHAAAWSSVRSSHVVVVGDAPAARLRDVSLEFERFRGALEGVLPNTPLVDTAPTVVVLLASDRAMRSFKPVREGKVQDDVSALALPGDDINYVVLSDEAGEPARQIALGAYAAMLLRSTIPGAPLWVVSGLGRYYSTFAASAEGKSAVVGTPPRTLLARARERLLSIESILAAGYNSALYRDDDEREIFEASCWALVHYLATQRPQGVAGLSTYLGMTMRGLPAVQAFSDTFRLEPAELTAALRQHVGRATAATTSIPLGDRAPAATPEPVEVLTDAHTQARIADIFVSLSRDVQAELALTPALAAMPPPAYAFLARGRLRLRQRRAADAWPDLVRAAEQSLDDYATQFLVGMTALRLAGDRPSDADRPRLMVGHRALERAVQLQPESAEALYAQARSQSLLGTDLGVARAAAEKAAELGPGREEYRLLVAQIALRQGDRSAAREAIGTLAARASRLEIVQRARTILAEVAKAESASAAEARASEPDEASPSRAEAPSVAGGTRGGGYELMLRATASAEQRGLGTVASIECGPLGVVFYVTLGGRHVRLFARAFEAVEFITYRDSVGGSVACGAQKSLDHVFVTWRPPASATTRMGSAYDGEVVAVEMLPRDYTP
jgi:tetratricopeptide (TPR) repeat protein